MSTEADVMKAAQTLADLKAKAKALEVEEAEAQKAVNKSKAAFLAISEQAKEAEKALTLVASQLEPKKAPPPVFVSPLDKPDKPGPILEPGDKEKPESVESLKSLWDKNEPAPPEKEEEEEDEDEADSPVAKKPWETPSKRSHHKGKN